MIGSRRMLVGLLALTVLLTTPSLACVPCCAPCANIAPGPTSPCGQIPVSRDAALRLEGKVHTMGTPDFELTVSDEELTSWIALQLPEFRADNPDLPTIPVTSPQICFYNGKVYVTGQLTDPVEADFSLVVSVRVVGDQVRLTMESGNLGPVPMPQDILDSLGKAAEETINDPSFNVQFTRVEVLDRVILVEGRVKQ